MKISLPLNDAFPQYGIAVRLPDGGEIVATYDNTHRNVEIDLPAGVCEDNVEVLGCALSAQGEAAPGCGPCILKERVAKPEPKPEPKAPRVKKTAPVESVAEPAAPVADPVEQAVTESSHNEP